MSAIVVAAGMGKRLKEFSRDRPKCMLEIDGISIFKRQTDLLLRNGISEINVVVGYKKEWFADDKFRYFINTDYENNNILHSLFYAEEAMDSGFLFSYSDIIYDGTILKQVLDSDSDIAIAVDLDWMGYYKDRKDHPVEEAELVFSEDGNTVSRIGKNTDYKSAFGEFLGLAKFSKQGARILKDVFYELKDYYSESPAKPFHTAKTFLQAYMTDMFQELVNRGNKIDIVKIKGNWAEIDIPRDLAVSRQFWGKVSNIS